MFKVINR